MLATLAIAHDTRTAAATDDLSRTINYASIANAVTNAFSTNSRTSSLHEVAKTLASSCLDRHPEVEELSVRACITFSSGTTAGVEMMASREHPCPMAQGSSLDGLKCRAIIGVNSEERTIPQPVVLDVAMEHPPGAEKPVRLQELEGVVAKVRRHS